MTSGDPYFPTFEGPDEHGNCYVNWRGRRWGLLTPIQDNWEYRDEWGYRHRSLARVELSFKMTELAEEQP